MSLKGSSKYIEHLLFMFALTSEDIVNCIMQSLSIFIFLRVAFLQFVTLLVTSLFSTLNKFSTVENLNTKPNGDIASVTSFRLGFNTSNVLNTSKIKDKKIVYVTVRSDNMHISTQLPKNISRAMLVHGTNARTAILSIEETGFWLYGDITGITGIFLAEYVYA